MGVIVQLGGQTALKLAEKLDRFGIPIVGTTYQSLDLAEDRGRFSTLLHDHGIPYPPFDVITRPDEARAVAEKLGYPILVRPSYVLGGQGMKIVINHDELETHVVELFEDPQAAALALAQWPSEGAGIEARGRYTRLGLARELSAYFDK